MNYVAIRGRAGGGGALSFSLDGFNPLYSQAKTPVNIKVEQGTEHVTTELTTYRNFQVSKSYFRCKHFCFDLI